MSVGVTMVPGRVVVFHSYSLVYGLIASALKHSTTLGRPPRIPHAIFAEKWPISRLCYVPDRQTRSECSAAVCQSHEGKDSTGGVLARGDRPKPLLMEVELQPIRMQRQQKGSALLPPLHRPARACAADAALPPCGATLPPRPPPTTAS